MKSRILPLLAAALVLASLPITAQTKAILKTGTVRSTGIPELGDIAVPVLSASYSLKGTTIPVYFTRMPLSIPNDAKKTAASPFFLKTVDKRIFAWFKAADFLLVAVFPPDIKERDSFLKSFAERFEYFYAYTPNDPDISFPAVLELK